MIKFRDAGLSTDLAAATKRVTIFSGALTLYRRTNMPRRCAGHPPVNVEGGRRLQHMAMSATTRDIDHRRRCRYAHV